MSLATCIVFAEKNKATNRRRRIVEAQRKQRESERERERGRASERERRTAKATPGAPQSRTERHWKKVQQLAFEIN